MDNFCLAVKVKARIALVLFVVHAAVVNTAFDYNRNTFRRGHSRGRSTRPNRLPSAMFSHAGFPFWSGESGQDLSQTNLSSDSLIRSPVHDEQHHSDDGTPQPAYVSRPVNLSYLDPRRFKSPTLTVTEMEVTLAEIEMHVGRQNNKTKTADYTGSRVLLQLLREQCAKHALVGDERIHLFCSQLDGRINTLGL